MAIINNSIVSMLDILGFSSLLCEETLDNVRSVIVGLEKLTDTNSHGVKSNGNITDKLGNVKGSLLGPDNANRLVEYRFAFDTMIYYTMNDEEKDFYYIIVTTAKLIAYTYFSIGLPVRGAISYGGLYVDHKNIFGKSLIDAHKYEMKQEWSGCILCPDLINRFQGTDIFNKMCSDNLLLEYDVPVKIKDDKGNISMGTERFYTINWMQYAGKSASIDDFKKQWSARRENDYTQFEEVKRKLENTVRFREYSLGININNIEDYLVGYTMMIR